MKMIAEFVRVLFFLVEISQKVAKSEDNETEYTRDLAIVPLVNFKCSFILCL